MRPVNVVTNANMDRYGTGLLLYFQITPRANTDFFLTGGVTRRDDDSPGARSPRVWRIFMRAMKRRA